MEELKFDPENVNIDLALEFFKKCNNQFYGSKSGKQIGFDGFNKVYYTDMSKIDEFKVYITEHNSKFNDLARLIEENAELFAQIEFAIRKKPKKEVKKYDIPIIAGYLRVLASGYSFTKQIPVVMHSNAPLANLGLLFRASKHIITCTLQTAAVTTLFAQLCSEAGIPMPEVLVIENSEQSRPLESQSRQEAASCLGVVTGSSDVDSAVDEFLRSTTKFPWKLSRILVEENIYDCFKSALSWKCRENRATTEADTFCTDVFKYGDKEFLCDYASVQNVNGIYVEAYRTTKELLSLLVKFKPFYLSLWCNNISEANEISYNDSAPFVIWINDYAVFGPPKASLPFYEMLFDDNVTLSIKKSFAKKIDTWRNKLSSDRREKIISSLEEIIAKTNEPALKLVRKELDFERDSVTVANSQLCTCMAVSRNCIFYYIENSELAVSLKLLIDGCVIITEENNDIFPRLPEDIPIIPLTATELAEDGIPMKFSNLPYRTKVVWSTYGTIFAN